MASSITPNCLKVDKAIIFFISLSVKALKLAKNIVIRPTLKSKFNTIWGIALSKRIWRYTPAVTRVKEWTKADTGVGAAIAAGSQALNGIYALLVMRAAITKKNHKLVIGK